VVGLTLVHSQDEGKFDPRSIPLKSWNDCVSHLFIDFLNYYNNLTYLFRKTSSGTKSLIIVLDHGYLQQRVKTKDTRNHGQHLYTPGRHTTNQEASHLCLLNAECILLLDTSQVAIRLNRLST
jgi:hypothetical protein